MASNNRMERINSEIKKEVSLIINNEISDPRVTGFVSVLNVQTTQDLKFCKIYISIYDDNREEAFEALKAASSFIRRRLSQSVKLREIPKLIFELDDGIEYSDKINKIIKSLDLKPLEDEEWSLSKK